MTVGELIVELRKRPAEELVYLGLFDIETHENCEPYHDNYRSFTPTMVTDGPPSEDGDYPTTAIMAPDHR